MRFKLLVGLLLGLASFAAQAELAEHSEQHFIIKHQFNSKKPLAEVYRQFKQVNKWWEAGHTFSGKAENLYFDFDQQRCYCEKLDNGGFIRHLAVIHVQPQKKVVFSGGLGPLQDQPVNGKMIWSFTESDKGVEVTVEYRVYGMIVGGMGEWPKAVDFVIGTQVKRLAELL